MKCVTSVQNIVAAPAVAGTLCSAVSYADIDMLFCSLRCLLAIYYSAFCFVCLRYAVLLFALLVCGMRSLLCLLAIYYFVSCLRACDIPCCSSQCSQASKASSKIAYPKHANIMQKSISQASKTKSAYRKQAKQKPKQHIASKQIKEQKGISTSAYETAEHRIPATAGAATKSLFNSRSAVFLRCVHKHAK